MITMSDTLISLSKEDIKKGVCIIPRRITYIADFACDMQDHLKKIIMKNVNCIGAGAFGCCINLKKVITSEKLTHVNDFAFDSCKKLKKIIFLNKEIKIEKNAFWECEKLKKIVIDNETIEVKNIKGYLIEILEKKKMHKRKVYKCCYFRQKEIFYAIQYKRKITLVETKKEVIEKIKKEGKRK